MIDGPTKTIATPFAECVARCEWQQTIFAEAPRRLDLLRLEAAWQLHPFRIRVVRNQSFELVATPLERFLAFQGLDTTFVYSDYDDSMTTRPTSAFDLDIIWFDFEHYRNLETSDLAGWLRERVASVRADSDAAILLTDWPSDSPEGNAFNTLIRRELATVPGVWVVPQHDLLTSLGPDFFDKRSESIAGFKLSDQAAIATAQCFGLRWIPAVTSPPLKAVFVDLDNTLYSGILGEDGPANVHLTAAHQELQQRLVKLHEQGVLLAVVTRNEPDDVATLFRSRTDFPLRLEQISGVWASWEPKHKGITSLARQFHIGVEAVLFVDDNLGELTAVAGELGNIPSLHASNPEMTARALHMYPGLTHLDATREDTLRFADISSDRERRDVAQRSAGPTEYLRELGIRLSFSINPRKDTPRILALSHKTNQFNMALSRLSEKALAQRMGDQECSIVTAALQDRLSDSGIIALLVGRRSRDRLRIEECCISCRALGREVEDIIITEAIRKMLHVTPADGVDFVVADGPRNGPALAWLSRYTEDRAAAIVTVNWPAMLSALASKRSLVTIDWSADR